MTNSQNKYVLITGATSGIGYELAKIFATNKFNLIIVARDNNALEEKAKEFRQQGIEVIPIAKNLFLRDQAFSLYTEIKERGLIVHILVNNAGQGAYGEFTETAIHRELDIIELNISSLIILTKEFVKDMVERKDGKILNLASIASKLPGPWQAVYHGTKAFVLSFSEAIREELKDTGVTVTALMPGATNTDFFNKADMLSSKSVQDKSALSDPAEVAKDGYEALMAGTDKVISGMKNKLQVGMSNVMPDAMLAHNLYEKQKPV